MVTRALLPRGLALFRFLILYGGFQNRQRAKLPVATDCGGAQWCRKYERKSKR
jgi:hypothetical protein